MLEFARRICLGMDITDFLKLQASLHADGIVYAPSDKENILIVSMLIRKPLDAFLVVQYFLDLIGNRL